MHSSHSGGPPGTCSYHSLLGFACSLPRHRPVLVGSCYLFSWSMLVTTTTDYQFLIHVDHCPFQSDSTDSCHLAWLLVGSNSHGLVTFLHVALVSSDFHGLFVVLFILLIYSSSRKHSMFRTLVVGHSVAVDSLFAWSRADRSYQLPRTLDSLFLLSMRL
jgi:hypothetical protein